MNREELSLAYESVYKPFGFENAISYERHKNALLCVRDAVIREYEQKKQLEQDFKDFDLDGKLTLPTNCDGIKKIITEFVLWKMNKL